MARPRPSLKAGWLKRTQATDPEADAPKHHPDFRRIYATVLESWLGLGSRAVLAPEFRPLEGAYPGRAVSG